MKRTDKQINILGVPVFGGTVHEVLELIQFATGPASTLTPLIILTPTTEQLVMAQTDDLLCTSFKKADITVPDGVGIAWATGNKVQRITGVDLAEKIMFNASKNGWRVFLVGGRGDTAVRAAHTLSGHFTGLHIDGFEGSTTIAHESEADRDLSLQKIKNFNTDVLFVAFGAPWQERWVIDNRERLREAGVKVAMVVGGAFDYWAGNVVRAPISWRRVGLEWLWRLLHEPWRWKRQTKLITFIWLVFKTRLLRG